MIQLQTSNYLRSGIYYMPEASRLLGVSYQRIRGWVEGYPRRDLPPVIDNEVGRVGQKLAISFINLIEAKFIAAFAARGVSIQAIRVMAREAQRFLNKPHPFATNVVFRSDTRRIFIEAEGQTGDRVLYDLKKRNFAFYDVLKKELGRAITYGESGMAEFWYPRKRKYPDILIHPRIAFGQPALRDSHVPTRALYLAYVAEGHSFERVSKWYDVPVSNVKNAVRFEKELIN